jgi:hypothetical protein
VTSVRDVKQLLAHMAFASSALAARVQKEVVCCHPREGGDPSIRVITAAKRLPSLGDGLPPSWE